MRQVVLSRRRVRCRCESSPALCCSLPTGTTRQGRLVRDDGWFEPNYSICAPCADLIVENRVSRVRQDGHEARHHTFSTLPLVIEPELYRHFGSRIVLRQRAEGIDALKCLGRRAVEGRHAARLLDLNVRRVTVA